MTVVQPMPCEYRDTVDGERCGRLAVATVPIGIGRIYVCSSCLLEEDVDPVQLERLMIGCSPATVDDVRAIEKFACELRQINTNTPTKGTP